MIDFRTHLISIIAIFFALATGIALGAGPLKGDIDDQLRSRVDDLGTQNQTLRDQVALLQRQDEARSAFVEQVVPQLVAGRLTGTRTLVLRLPGTSDDVVDGILTTLRQAGGRPTGTVEVTDAWVDPDRQSELDNLVQDVAPPGLNLPESTAYERAAAVLSEVLLTRDEPAQSSAGAAARSALAALDEAGFLRLDAGPPGPANLGLVLTGPPQQGVDPTPYVALARAADRAGRGTVVAGPAAAAEDGGVLGAIRADSALAADVSTVDGVDLPIGEVATVYAMQEQNTGGSGQYGSAGTTDGPLPSPSPAPSPSASASTR